jgi:hypothetical protein
MSAQREQSCEPKATEVRNDLDPGRKKKDAATFIAAF